jgi:hypothetical protein
MQGFKGFLLNEEKSYLGHRIGDVLTVVQDLQTDIEGMGLRQITRIAQDIVNQIRKILHSEWSPRQMPQLRELQKVGVALMKAIEEKDDLKQIIPQLSQKIEEIGGKLGEKMNNLKGDKQTDNGNLDGSQVDMQMTPPPAPPQNGQPNVPQIAGPQPPPAANPMVPPQPAA